MTRIKQQRKVALLLVETSVRLHVLFQYSGTVILQTPPFTPLARELGMGKGKEKHGVSSQDQT